MFSYVTMEARIPADHPLRPIREEHLEYNLLSVGSLASRWTIESGERSRAMWLPRSSSK
jgi:hypothetical protein